MKIGQFSKKYEVSKDTIRHYMDMGLILPIKEGGQYFFDDRCQKDMSTVLEMKALGFPLDLIRSFQFYKRVSRMKSLDHEKFYHELIKNQLVDVEDQLKNLNVIKSDLQVKLEDTQTAPPTSLHKMGVPLEFLSLVVCPLCKGTLTLSGSEIVNNNVITGQLKCSCGEVLPIVDGILISGAYKEMPPETKIEEDMQFFLADYIKHTPAVYFENLYTGFQWTKSRMNFENLSNKLILELGSGLALFLRTIYDSLPEDVFYVCVDHNEMMQKFLKSILEQNAENKKIVFILSDFNQIPLKPSSVDALIDMAGTSNYMLNNLDQVDESFLLNTLSGLYKPDMFVASNYFAFDKYDSNHPVIPLNKRTNFQMDYIRRSYEDTNIQIVDQLKSNTLPLGGKYESFFGKGDQVSVTHLIGKYNT